MSDLVENTAANKAHKSRIMREAKEGLIGEVKYVLMGTEISESMAKAVILAIVAGKVPHVSMEF